MWFKRWKAWRKHNLNSKFYQFLVLLKIVESPTMPYTFTDEELQAFQDGFREGLKRGLENEQ